MPHPDLIKCALIFLREHFQEALDNGWLEAAACELITVEELQEEIDNLGG